MATITLTDPFNSTAWACEAHSGWPLHLVSECDRLAGVQPFSEHIACSVCGLAWGGGAVSAHLACANLRSDGQRIPASPVVTYLSADEPVVIESVPVLLSTEEVAAELGLERTRVQQLAKARGLGTPVGSAGWRVFTHADVEAMRVRRPGRPRKP